MLVKLTCRGYDFETAVRRARRAVAEFRIRGVSTNIPFLAAVLEDPDFVAGRITTSFIDERPQLLTTHGSADRGTKILNYLADVTVNKPYGDRPSTVYPSSKLPGIDLRATPPAGSKQKLTDLGPQGFARWLRDSPALGVTDTTFRDAHQSLLATRVRSNGLLTVAPYVARMMPHCCRSSAGAGPPTMSHCGSSRRIPGNAWPHCGRPCRTSACRCCSAAVTPWATPPTQRPSPRRSWTKPPAPASTSSGSSTH